MFNKIRSFFKTEYTSYVIEKENELLKSILNVDLVTEDDFNFFITDLNANYTITDNKRFLTVVMEDSDEDIVEFTFEADINLPLHEFYNEIVKTLYYNV